ncbi:MAG: hypothetical protein EBU80_10705 [Chitinophagia bacterium]|nr:hypothetical protein [Chitinophagia bacterium]
MNFFRWAIQYDVIDYIKDHIEDIDKDMNASLKYDKEESDAQRSEDSISSQESSAKKEIRRRKRHELSVSAAKSMSRHNVNIVVEFS